MLVLGKYEIIDEAGRGGMGVVYRAIDKRLSRTVALKELVIGHSIIGQDKDDIIARFNQEAQTAALLNHPNIITIFDVGEDNGKHFIAMEFLPGKSLKDFLDEGYKFTSEEILDILIQIASGLEHAHTKGVVHRDIKPDNMKMLEGNTVKITDFGIARIESSTSNLTQDGTMLGTLGYISPEQLHNSKGVDNRADIFSFGAMIYEIFTKKLPFDGGTVGSTILKIMTENPVPPRDLNSEIPEPLEKVIMKCLIKDPDKRYQRFKEIIDELTLVKMLAKNPSLLGMQTTTKTLSPTPPAPPIEKPIFDPKLTQPQISKPTPVPPINTTSLENKPTFAKIEDSHSFQGIAKAEQNKENKPTPYQNMMKTTLSGQNRPIVPPANLSQSSMNYNNIQQQAQHQIQNINETEIRVIFVRSIGRVGAAKGQFSAPKGIAFSNHHGYVLIADTQNRRVQVFDPIGNWQFLIQNSEMQSPVGIAVDNAGKIYVVDSGDCKVRVFNTNGTMISSFGGKGSTNGLMKSVTGISVSNDKVYIVDNENFRVNVFNINGTYQTYIGKYGEKPGEYKNPYSVASDNNRLYILDYGLARVQVIDKDGISRAIFGQRGGMKGQFSIPKGIGIDKFGRIYVCDTLNHRVQVFDKTGKWIYSFGNKGSEQGQFVGPEGIAIANDGNIYVLDKGNNRVQVFTYEV